MPRPKSGDYRVTTIRLLEDQLEALNEIAEKEDRSVNWIIRQAIGEYLENHKKGKK
ncbi:MAG: ribbon-helix-helix domain-containing protein [Treponema sp.]|nr:ribbon-helix-helix domain-containing protein [Treponema sp.]